MLLLESPPHSPPLQSEVLQHVQFSVLKSSRSPLTFCYYNSLSWKKLSEPISLALLLHTQWGYWVSTEPPSPDSHGHVTASSFRDSRLLVYLSVANSYKSPCAPFSKEQCSERIMIHSSVYISYAYLARKGTSHITRPDNLTVESLLGALLIGLRPGVLNY